MMPEQDRQRRADFAGQGVRSLFAAPIMSRDGDVRGALILLDAEPNAFDEYDERRAVGLTRRAAIVLENARLFSQSQEMQEQLRKANVAKDEFLAVMSHELRTPITTIYGGARLLQSRGASLPPESTAEMITSLEEESERLYRLVEDLLTIARSELGEEPTMEPIQLAPLVEQVVRQFSHRRPNRPIDIKAPGVPAVVMGETTYLRQILNNLLTNSDKYSETGLPIDIEISAGPQETVVSVLDRGPGVAPEEMDSIFDSFYRSEKTAKQAGGKGLGLTVCKRLIDAMSGRIWATAREGGGLVVSFAVPNASDLGTAPDPAPSEAGASPS
jgi:K+-sensing histidine kinase KdpD